jgi:hypothetical protein
LTTETAVRASRAEAEIFAAAEALCSRIHTLQDDSVLRNVGKFAFGLEW